MDCLNFLSCKFWDPIRYNRNKKKTKIEYIPENFFFHQKVFWGLKFHLHLPTFFISENKNRKIFFLNIEICYLWQCPQYILIWCLDNMSCTSLDTLLGLFELSWCSKNLFSINIYFFFIFILVLHWNYFICYCCWVDPLFDVQQGNPISTHPPGVSTPFVDPGHDGRPHPLSTHALH